MVKKAADILRAARSLFVLTGAGISAESGIPTFRGKDGLWKNYSATDLATPEAFSRNPELVWEWYHWRQGIILKSKPNPGHYALVELEKRSDRFLLLTQNVDNLHRRAGSEKILELHGNIFRARCLQCHKIIEYRGSKSDTARHCEERSDEAISQLTSKKDAIATSRRCAGGTRNDHAASLASQEMQVKGIPTCACGGRLRPDVVWFGEMIPQDIWHTSLEFLSTADVALICGTSGVVYPAAAIPEIAHRTGAKTIEINLEQTPISDVVDVSLLGKTGAILPELLRVVQNE